MNGDLAPWHAVGSRNGVVDRLPDELREGFDSPEVDDAGGEKQRCSRAHFSQDAVWSCRRIPEPMELLGMEFYPSCEFGVEGGEQMLRDHFLERLGLLLW